MSQTIQKQTEVMFLLYFTERRGGKEKGGTAEGSRGQEAERERTNASGKERCNREREEDE